MGELAQVPGWVVGSGGGVGAFVVLAFVWTKWLLPWLAERADKRQQSRTEGNREWEGKLRAREEALDKKIADSLAKCERDCEAMWATMTKMHFVIVLITPEVERYAPASPLLMRAKLLLAELTEVLPLPLDLPAEMQAQLDLLDTKTGAPAFSKAR